MPKMTNKKPNVSIGFFIFVYTLKITVNFIFYFKKISYIYT